MKLLVIDGNSIMNRAFYGIRVLTNKKGMPTNALTGFLNIFLKLMKEEAPDRIAVAFDLHAPTFRHKMYADYKGTRHAMPDELRAQMPIIKQILTALGVAIVEKEGYEADDIIGTLSHAAESQGGECTISTGDRDSFQLITDKVTVRLASNKEDIIYTPAKIAEVYGVTPREMLEVKTLMGDSSDNIPGVPGVGEKTALGLIQKYHTVDYIYQNLDTIEVTKGVRAKLENGRESAELSRKLAEITLEAPVELDMSAYEKKDGDPAEAAGILTEMEMFGVMKKLGLDKTAPAKVALASIASEGTAPAPDNAGTPAVEAAEKADIPEFDPAAYDVAFSGGEVRVFLAGKPQEGAAAILASEAPKRTDDAKALYSYCMKNGMELKNVVFDAALAGYLLNVNSSDYTVERLCAEYGVTYSAERLGESLFLLNRALWEKIHQQEMYGVLADIEIPLAEVLSSMEIEGVKLDTEALREFGDALQPKIKEIEQDIYKEAGHEFNIGSPKQLSVVLFEELGLPAGKKRKTGYSTDADTLEGLRGRHPIIPLIFDYRTLTKLYNTYVKGLEAAVSPDGRMHTTFKQTETRTGRISSAEPNIQNMPVRTEIGSGGGQNACRRGLQPDRAARTGAPFRRQGDDKDLLRGRRYPHRDRRKRPERPAGADHSGAAPQREGGKFRHCVRHRRVFACKGYQRVSTRGEAVYRRLPDPLFRRESVYGQGDCKRRKGRLGGHDVRQEAFYSGDTLDQQDREGSGKAYRDEHTDTGHGCGYHQDSYDTRIPQAERRAPRGKADTPGA